VSGRKGEVIVDIVLKRLQRNIEKINEKYMEFKKVERGKVEKMNLSITKRMI